MSLQKPLMLFYFSKNQIKLIMSSKDIERHPLGGRFEFRFEPIYNTIFLLMKYGDYQWMSAPYSPHLLSVYKKQVFNDGEGMEISILQICNVDGKIHDVVHLVLPNDFSNFLCCTTDIIYNAFPFNFVEYRQLIFSIYNRLTSNQLAEKCDKECRCIVD